ncbi:hypothetical protein QYF61_007257 [Mycteria americana]|uniref:Uncharacterized protein n=1 Tax=Mycteria americana TaxID=33587 RepID=A0AAN7S5Z0_MYCAM|nr:hypothetical protein QYF61_007257 [Mycteria americana]
MPPSPQAGRGRAGAPHPLPRRAAAPASAAAAAAAGCSHPGAAPIKATLDSSIDLTEKNRRPPERTHVQHPRVRGDWQSWARPRVKPPPREKRTKGVKRNRKRKRRDIFNYIRLLRAPSNLTFNVSRDGASTTSLGNLFQCFTTLTVKNFFLRSSPTKKFVPIFLIRPLEVLKGCNKVLPEPSLFSRLNNPNPLSLSSQESPGCGWLSGLRAHIVSSYPAFHPPASPSPSLQGCSQSLHPPACIDTGIAPTQVQDLALGFVEPHEVHMGPLLKLVQVPLDGIPSLRHVNCTTQLGVTCKLAEGALDPTVYVIDEDIKQYWSQYGPLRDTTCHRSPSGH